MKKKKSQDPRWDNDLREAAKHIRKLLAMLETERARSAKLIEQIKLSTDCTNCGDDIRAGVYDSIAEYEASRD